MKLTVYKNHLKSPNGVIALLAVESFSTQLQIYWYFKYRIWLSIHKIYVRK